MATFQIIFVHRRINMNESHDQRTIVTEETCVCTMKAGFLKQSMVHLNSSFSMKFPMITAINSLSQCNDLVRYR